MSLNWNRRIFVDPRKTRLGSESTRDERLTEGFAASLKGHLYNQRREHNTATLKAKAAAKAKIRTNLIMNTPLCKDIPS